MYLQPSDHNQTHWMLESTKWKEVQDLLKVCTYIMYVYIYVYMYVMYTSDCVHVHVCTCTQVYSCMYIHVLLVKGFGNFIFGSSV